MNRWKPSKGGEAEVNKRQHKVITPETLEKKARNWWGTAQPPAPTATPSHGQGMARGVIVHYQGGEEG